MMTSTPLPGKTETKEEKEEKSKDEQSQEEPEEDAILENQLRLAVEVFYIVIISFTHLYEFLNTRDGTFIISQTYTINLID